MDLTVLIVDDSAVMRKIVERALRNSGVAIGKVLEAGDGQEALGLLEKNKVNLIVSDINMPVMDGLEFVRQVQSRELAGDAPIVMITTEKSEGAVRAAIGAGVGAYVPKPFTVDQVRVRVMPLLGGES